MGNHNSTWGERGFNHMGDHNTTFFCLPVTGELLIELFKKMGVDLPDDAVLVKVSATNEPTYCFDFMFHSKARGWRIPESVMVPRGMKTEESDGIH